MRSDVATQLTSVKPLASFDRPRADSSVSIAVVSDPHISTRASGTARLYHRTEHHLSNAIADINDRTPDFVIFAGDLTKDGARWDFDAFDELIEALVPPFRAIPGNHDVEKSHNEHDPLPRSEFERRYTADGLPFVESVGDVDLIGLDSAGFDSNLGETHDGRVSDEQVAWLDDVLGRTSNPIVTLHHNLPGTTAQIETYLDEVENMAIPNVLQDVESLVDVLDSHGVPLVLTGHRHIPGIAQTRSVWEVMSPTTCTFPQGYVYLEVGPDGTTASFVPVADYEGMRDAQIARLNGSRISRSYGHLAAIRLASPSREL